VRARSTSHSSVPHHGVMTFMITCQKLSIGAHHFFAPHCIHRRMLHATLTMMSMLREDMLQDSHRMTATNQAPTITRGKSNQPTNEFKPARTRMGAEVLTTAMMTFLMMMSCHDWRMLVEYGRPADAHPHHHHHCHSRMQLQTLHPSIPTPRIPSHLVHVDPRHVAVHGGSSSSFASLCVSSSLPVLPCDSAPFLRRIVV